MQESICSALDFSFLRVVAVERTALVSAPHTSAKPVNREGEQQEYEPAKHPLYA
jgi:hypothetical protein